MEYSQEKIEEVVKLLKEGFNYSEIERVINIPYRTIARWAKKYELTDLNRFKRIELDKEKFELIVKESFSIRESLTKLGVVAVGGNYRVFKRNLQKWNVDSSHFTGQSHNKGKSPINKNEFSIEKSFVKNGSLSSSNLSKKIQKHKLKPYECSNNNCTIKTQWLNQDISLHLDHINGDNTDNTLDNLRFLCPNCHSQTKTYCRNKRD